MTLPRVSICGWCGRALGLESDRRLLPGEHVGKIRVTTKPCDHCKVRLEKLGLGSVSHSDMMKRHTQAQEEKKGGP